MIGNMRNPKGMPAQAGFTLVELLVASALFATVIAVAVNLFILTLRKPLVEVDNQHLQEEVSYLFEVLASRMLESQIGYAYYSSPLPNPQNQLYLTNAAGLDATRYYLSGGQIRVEELSSGTSYPITTTANNDVVIDSIRFYIYPQSDPTDPSASVNYQPMVVVSVVGHSVKDAARTFKLQTILTTRVYVR